MKKCECKKNQIPKMKTGFKYRKPKREKIHIPHKHLQPNQIGGTIWKKRYLQRQNV